MNFTTRVLYLSPGPRGARRFGVLDGGPRRNPPVREVRRRSEWGPERGGLRAAAFAHGLRAAH